MNCSICNEPVVLNPSAAERAKKFGGVPSDYTKLFPTHNACAIEAREKDTRELMSRINSEYESGRKRKII